MKEKETLSGKTLAELNQLVVDLGMPSFAAKQIAGWLYKKKAADIDEMTNLSRANRNKLKEYYTTGVSDPVRRQISSDGTIKYLFPTSSGHFIETVYIPENDRATLCVSSQIGCKMNCLFCMTGKQGFSGNLSSCDIMNQIRSVPENDRLTNIVFMGMGEPMDNIDELFKVLEILTADYGYAWSPKRITVSTIGVIPALKRFIEESRCHLAISVHSPYPSERKTLMPVEKAYPLEEVLKLIRRYDFFHQRRVSFEYILFKGLNDDLQHAGELVRLLSGIPSRINLIKYHAIPGVALESSDTASMPAFRDFLSSKGITCTIRTSRGEDILAACGMLSTQENRIFASEKNNDV